MSYSKAFIETQFPVAKLSKEAYKERKAGYKQTLTGLGKWWGRKPLILCRAVILGCLLPATDDPEKDREVFLELMGMDEKALRQRFEQRQENTPNYFNKAKDLKFNELSYEKKLEWCCRPEELDDFDPDWERINLHLGTQAHGMTQLIEQLSVKRFGHRARVGDAFCGGGSLPFEAARLGCEAYGSDLNPYAMMLSWGAQHLIGGGQENYDQFVQAQHRVFEAVQKQIRQMQIETNEQRWQAEYFLYCLETTCPQTGVNVPLLPSLVIGHKRRAIAKLVQNKEAKRIDLEIKQDVSQAEMKEAEAGTLIDGKMVYEWDGEMISIPISTIRGDKRDTGKNKLRQWANEDIDFREDDIFRERLYCIRWAKPVPGKKKDDLIYASPTEADKDREKQVNAYVKKNLMDWQLKGYIPTWAIQNGEKTDEPIRTRGWTHWHHLFNPRQLLVNGLMLKAIMEGNFSEQNKRRLLLRFSKFVDYSNRLTRWTADQSKESNVNLFSNQALNTLYNYGARGMNKHETSWFWFNEPPIEALTVRSKLVSSSAEDVEYECDLWITDPPYADAVNYHELTEFFLSWYSRQIPRLFPEWYADSKRALAVKGSDESFRLAMARIYSHLSTRMPDHGMQVVMFTHQDAGVWADLGLILWTAGLQVTAAWTIGTETDTALKKGNYVQGTVLLVLRKRQEEEEVFEDELISEIRPEVARQLSSMQQIDDTLEPNFGDSDYQLASYAAALRVITRYRIIEGIDAQKELLKERRRGEKSPFEKMIEQALKVASGLLIPQTIAENESQGKALWNAMTAEEKFYLKGLDVERKGENRQGVYQEFARGYGLNDYKHLLGSTKANAIRLKSPSDFKRTQLDHGFGQTLVRHILFATYLTAKEGDPKAGLQWLKGELPTGLDFYHSRQNILLLLRYLSRHTTLEWETDAQAATLLAGAVENVSI